MWSTSEVNYEKATSFGVSTPIQPFMLRLKQTAVRGLDVLARLRGADRLHQVRRLQLRLSEQLELMTPCGPTRRE